MFVALFVMDSDRKFNANYITVGCHFQVNSMMLYE